MTAAPPAAPATATPATKIPVGCYQLNPDTSPNYVSEQRVTGSRQDS